MQGKVRELNKYIVMKKTTFERKTLALIQSIVNELAFLFVNHVVIANLLLTSLGLAHFVWTLSDSTASHGISNSNEALKDEVHLIDLLVLIIYDLVIVCV